MKYFAVFYIEHAYYYPHFLPIYEVLKARGYEVCFVISDKNGCDLPQRIASTHELPYLVGESHLFEIESAFFLFANPFARAPELHGKTIFLEHGIGTKSNSFYPVVEYIDLYLVESRYKYERIASLYPAHKEKLHQVGYSKFDPIVNRQADKASLYQAYNLDPAKKTILYAPTFFPSSIEKMHRDFPKDFACYNILVKPHYFSYAIERYRAQRKRLEYWSQFENCTVLGIEAYDLIPLFAISDVMISDESSAMFEFASLDKPVISNRFYKLRLSYYLMPWKLKRRIDQQKDKYRQMLENADSYTQMCVLVEEALENPTKNSHLRRKYATELCGKIDGKASTRIVDLMERVASHPDRAG